MQRREFITLLCGTATALPFPAHAQPVDNVRRIGVLMTTAETDLEGQSRVGAFIKRLQELGWT